MTLYQHPGKVTPSNNNAFFIVQDNHYLDPGYKYYFQVILGDITNPIIYTASSYPKPYADAPGILGHAAFDLSPILKDYLTASYKPNIIVPTIADSNEIVKYNVNYAGGTDPLSLSFDTYTGIAWNGCVDWFSAQELDPWVQFHLPNISSPGYYLNIKNYNREITLDDYSTLSFFRTDETTTVTAMVVTLDDGSTFIKYFNTLETDEWINHIGVGPLNLNATTWDVVGTPSHSINSTTKSYTVNLYCPDGDHPIGHKLFQTVTYRIICTKFNKYRVDFQAQGGGFNSLLFYGKHYKTLINKKELFNKRLPYNYTNIDIGMSVYKNESSNTYILNTDWMTQDKVDEVEELLSSPRIYIQDNTMNLEAIHSLGYMGKIMPVYIDSYKDTINYVKQDKLVQMQIEFISANNKNNINL